jgi:hypothetical protein
MIIFFDPNPSDRGAKGTLVTNLSILFILDFIAHWAGHKKSFYFCVPSVVIFKLEKMV